MHTKLPWSVHPNYVDEPAVEFEFKGDKVTARNVTIASGDKIIGKLTMCAGRSPGHLGNDEVDSEQELLDNAALLFKAVNTHDVLVAALNAYQAAGIGVATDYLLQSVAFNLAVTALAGVDE